MSNGLVTRTLMWHQMDYARYESTDEAFSQIVAAVEAVFKAEDRSVRLDPKDKTSRATWGFCELSEEKRLRIQAKLAALFPGHTFCWSGTSVIMQMAHARAIDQYVQ